MKKFISVILTIALCVGALSVCVFAADDIHPSAKGNEIIACETLAVLAVLGLGSDAPAVITTPGEDIDIPIFFTAFLDVYATVFHYLGLIYSLISGILV